MLFGSVGVASITGAWVTSGRVQVVQGAKLTVDDVKGWMTIQEAADGLGIPAATIIGLISPDSPGTLSPATKFKDVEKAVPGFSLSTLRGQLRDLAPVPPIAAPTR